MLSDTSNFVAGFLLLQVVLKIFKATIYRPLKVTDACGIHLETSDEGKVETQSDSLSSVEEINYLTRHIHRNATDLHQRNMGYGAYVCVRVCARAFAGGRAND